MQKDLALLVKPDEVIYTKAGQEIAVATTKAYTKTSNNSIFASFKTLNRKATH